MKAYNGCLPPVFRMIISGASSSGKSTLLGDLLENRNGVLHSDFERVIYLRGVPTKNEDRLRAKFGRNLIVFDEIPAQETILPFCDGRKRTVLVIEDLDEQACSSPLISKFFCAYSHHKSCSIVFTTQNFFRAGRERLTLVRNATHLVLFPNNLDESVIRVLAQKVHAKNPKALVNLFDSVTREPFAHLSLWSQCPKELKFRSHINRAFHKVYDIE